MKPIETGLDTRSYRTGDSFILIWSSTCAITTTNDPRVRYATKLVLLKTYGYGRSTLVQYLAIISAATTCL
jgi:hypothetical protein